MKDEYRVLVLEDNPADAELIERELRKTGLNFSSKRVETRKDFVKELENPPDLLLVDYSLPEFDGVFAFSIARDKAPDTPFVFVSGAMSEELATEMLKMGASDWISKNQLFRLGPVVSRVIKAAEERVRYSRMEGELTEAEKKPVEISKPSPEAIFETDLKGDITFINQAGLKFIGYSQKDLDKGLNGMDFLIREDRGRAKESIKKALSEKIERIFEGTAMRKNGEKLPVAVYFTRIVHGKKVVGFRGTIINIKRKPVADEKKQLRGGPRKKPRDIVDIYADILRVAGKGVSKTRLVTRTNLNFPRFARYLAIMAEEGLLTVKPGPPKVFSVTEKGLEFLKKYKELKNAFGSAR